MLMSETKNCRSDEPLTGEALTVALMGLLAEESLIAVRLGRLGRKRTVA
jgi:hypothetical protein